MGIFVDRALPLHTFSPAMQPVYDAGVRAAATDANILIQGEDGVGKNVMAYRLHALSKRAGNAMLSMHCASLSEVRIESELFGYERNAFTGTTKAQPGVLERADGGTLFLDEIGELPLVILGKLSVAIETRSVYRVGAAQGRPIDVRFIAATSRDLKAEIVKATRYAEQYLRLIEVSLVIPPLRERRSEIPELARLFAAEACEDQGRSLLPIAPAAMAVLEGLLWPGNIRGLWMAMQRAVILCNGSEIGPENLPAI